MNLEDSIQLSPEILHSPVLLYVAQCPRVLPQFLLTQNEQNSLHATMCLRSMALFLVLPDLGRKQQFGWHK